MAFFATCLYDLVIFWKCCCCYGEPENTFGAPPPQGGSSYGESEKKVSFESIVLSREACGASSPGSPPSTAGRPTNGQNEAAYVLGDTVAIKYVVEPSIDAILLSIEPQKISEKPPRGPMGTCKDSTPDLSLSK